MSRIIYIEDDVKADTAKIIVWENVLQIDTKDHVSTPGVLFTVDFEMVTGAVKSFDLDIVVRQQWNELLRELGQLENGALLYRTDIDSGSGKVLYKTWD